MSLSTARRLFSTLKNNDVVIVSFARTPIAKFCGGLSNMTATQIGAVAVKEAVARAGIKPDDVEEVLLGNVVSAGVGQAPARQAAIYAGLPKKVSCTTINKVCASGMKTIMFASQAIQTGYRNIMIAGGFESMSNIPHYLPGSRNGFRLGNSQIVDGLIHDGLWDIYNNQHMGMCGEDCAQKFSISREEQDRFAIESYSRAKTAVESGKFVEEIVPVSIPQKKGEPLIFDTDEEYKNIDLNKLSSLRPAFKKDGTVTAANASTLNDGGAALVVMSAGKAREMGLKPLALIRGFADAERDPVEFTIAPSDAVPLALRNAGVSASDVDYHEINEAFSVVAIANMRLLNLDPSRVNVNGGAVALGHPIGMSGARIVGTLYHILKQRNGTIGCASICNGGGGASAIVIERLN